MSLFNKKLLKKIKPSKFNKDGSLNVESFDNADSKRIAERSK